MKVHLLASGEVSLAVAARLSTGLRSAGDAVRTDVVGTAATGPTAHERALDPSTWPDADLRVVVAWRESRRLLEAVDRSAAETRVPYAQAVVTHPRLRVGPTVVPGPRGARAGAGCRVCLDVRQRQHDPGVAKAEALWRRYDEDPSAGPSGFLPHHVSLAVALLARTTTAAREGRLEEERGIVRTAHLLQGTLHATRLVPVHGCRRCGTPRPDASWADLTGLGRLAVAPAVAASPRRATAPTDERSTARG